MLFFTDIEEIRRNVEGSVGNLGEVNHANSDERVTGRKRVRNFDSWIKNIRKRKRTVSQEYRNIRGKRCHGQTVYTSCL